MPTNAITIHEMKKRFRVGTREQYPTIRDSLARGMGMPMRALRGVMGKEQAKKDMWFWALNGINMHIDEGEVVGIIGKNGAGKSTLLKILSGITEPTSGYADIRGRVGSLLEVGTGFHMELSGRENIYMNGALLGMKRREIQEKFDEIVDFSEVGQFLDTPVKRYSSGMYMRLAFAVAAHLEPDILIVDEVLAVGDAAFQKKCLGKMSTIAGEGRTVLFVSHNMASVESLCSRAVMIDKGVVVDEGLPRNVIGRYLNSVNADMTVPLAEREDREGDGRAKMTSLSIKSLDEDGVIRSTSRIQVIVSYTSDGPLRRPGLTLDFYDPTNVPLFMLDSSYAGGLPDELPAEGAIHCTTAPLNLAPGPCIVRVCLDSNSQNADEVDYAMEFTIEEDDFFGTGKLPSRDWSISLIKQEWGAGDTG